MSFRFKLAIHFEFSDYFVGKVSRVFIQESVISVLKKMFLRENTVNSIILNIILNIILKRVFNALKTRFNFPPPRPR